MNEQTGKYFLINGSIKKLENFDEICSNIKFGVYEVIRIINGIPLFCEDHFSRMNNSLHKLNKQLNIDYYKFESYIKLLLKENEYEFGNIKIIVDSQLQYLIMHIISHHYPTGKEYKQGVKTGLFEAERINPNIKTHLIELRKQVSIYLKEKNLFEVLYVDKNGIITEGSKTNVFFIKKGFVYTCTHNKVLEGITRKKVIKCLTNLNIPLVKKLITKDEIDSFESAFITGTSPKVLPIASIDNISFSSSNKTMGLIMEEYNQMVEQYIRSKRTSEN